MSAKFKISDEIITVSHGAQFGNGLPILVFVLVIIGLTITPLPTRFSWIALISLPILILCAFSILNIQGVQFNTYNKQVRKYKLSIFGKSGKWFEMKNFIALSIHHEPYKVIRNLREYEKPLIGEYEKFVLALLPKSNQDTIVVAETNEYSYSLQIANKIRKHLNIRLLDACKETNAS